METRQLDLQTEWTNYDRLLAVCLYHAYSSDGRPAFGRQTLYNEWQAGMVTEDEAAAIAAECGWFWYNLRCEQEESQRP